LVCFNSKNVEEFVKDFKFCEICGMKAVKDETCLHCYSDVWNEELKEDYETKEDYIKADQLDLYSIVSSLSRVDFNRYDNSGFEKNPDFKVSVTKEEVFKYSEENFFES